MAHEHNQRAGIVKAINSGATTLDAIRMRTCYPRHAVNDGIAWLLRYGFVSEECDGYRSCVTDEAFAREQAAHGKAAGW